jgi:hypothetical protein
MRTIQEAHHLYVIQEGPIHLTAEEAPRSLESSIKLQCPVLVSLRSWIQTKEHAMSITAPAHIKLLCGLSL